MVLFCKKQTANEYNILNLHWCKECIKAGFFPALYQYRRLQFFVMTPMLCTKELRVHTCIIYINIHVYKYIVFKMSMLRRHDLHYIHVIGHCTLPNLRLFWHMAIQFTLWLFWCFTDTCWWFMFVLCNNVNMSFVGAIC